MPRVSDRYDQNVFINCPFDGDYQPIFNALVFATFECGLRPRCALEIYDAGEVRIEKIARIIRECHWGIHDISRTELNPSGLPRFNMPLELGIFLGARWFGDRPQKRKSCLVLDTDRYRYQQFMSDIAGQDIAAHQGEARRAIKAVRDWLGASRAGIQPPPGAAAISRRFDRFTVDLPAICAETDREVGDLTFTEFADAASTWLRAELARTETKPRSKSVILQGQGAALDPLGPGGPRPTSFRNTSINGVWGLVPSGSRAAPWPCFPMALQ